MERLKESRKKGSFLVAGPLRGGGGLTVGPLRKRTFFAASLIKKKLSVAAATSLRIAEGGGEFLPI